MPGALAYTLYRGQVWEGLASDKVNAERAGHVKDFDLESLGKLQQHTAIQYEGWINIADPGRYTFFLKMNGGSLAVDGKQLIQQEPSDRRGVKQLEGAAELDAGWRKIQLTYFHTGREPKFSFEMQGPQFTRGPIPSSMLSVSKEPIPPFEPLKVDAALAARGREHFAKLGCANCHDDLKVASKSSVAFAKLDATRGCLSESRRRVAALRPERGAARVDRQGIAPCGATDARRPAAAQQDARHVQLHRLPRTHRARRNCSGAQRALHRNAASARRSRSPAAAAVPRRRQAEARVDRRSDATRETSARLPRREPCRSLAKRTSGISWSCSARSMNWKRRPSPRWPTFRNRRKPAYEMIGTAGLSCIVCHEFNGQKSGEVSALDLVHVTERLQKNWFHLYLRQPSRFHPNVIMPSYWPDGQSVRPTLLGGDAAQQIEALWLYLEDGTRVKKPLGLSRQSSEIRVGDVTEICRGQSPVGYRGIGVGYPERINLAFDSGEMALRQLWKGEFANVDFGHFRPRGTELISFPPGIPFHRLKSLEENWPYKGKTNHGFPQDLGYQFRGYHLDAARRPTLLYHYGDIAVEDYFEDVRGKDGKAYFKRTLRFEAPTAPAPFHFRAAAGKKVSAQSERSFAIDKLQLRITSDHKGIVRDGDAGEVLIPLTLPAGRSTLTLEYQW